MNKVKRGFRKFKRGLKWMADEHAKYLNDYKLNVL